MYTYPLRALSKCGRYLISFDLIDGPCSLDSKTFFLSRKPGTPILRYDSLMRGSDIPNLFAGDYVQKNSRIYLLTYSRGLVAKDIETSDMLDLSDGEYTIISNIYNWKEDIKLKPSQPLYKYKDSVFYFKDVYGVLDGKLALNRSKNRLINAYEVRQYSGIKHPVTRKELFFGEHDLHLKNGYLYGKNSVGEMVNITLGGSIK